MANLLKALTEETGIRAYVIDSTNIVTEAARIHGTWPAVTAALGRTLTAAALIGSMQKEDGAGITIQIKGDGPIGSIVAVSDDRGNVRGYAQNPFVDLPLSPSGKLDVASAVGREGFINVITDPGFGEPHVGSVPLTSGEIAEDITTYFAVSEQIPTACGLGVLVGRDLTVAAAGGFIVQVMPGASDESVDRLEANIAGIRPVTEMVDDGMTVREIMTEVLSGFKFEIVEERECAYLCNCSRSRVERALISLGESELRQMLEEDGEGEVSCQFCNEKYHFTRSDIEELISASKSRPSPS